MNPGSKSPSLYITVRNCPIFYTLKETQFVTRNDISRRTFKSDEYIWLCFNIDEHRIMMILVVMSFVIIFVISCVLRYLWLRTFSSPRPRQAEHELDVLESQFDSEEIDEMVGDNPTHSFEVLKSSIIISRFYLIIYIIIFHSWTSLLHTSCEK